MERRRKFTLGGAMASIVIIGLLLALMVQTWKATEREARLQAEIDELRAKYEIGGEAIVYPSRWNPNITDNMSDKVGR